MPRRSGNDGGEGGGGAALEPARVLERRDLTPELMHLWLERPEGFSFKAGQYCTIGLDGVERA